MPLSPGTRLGAYSIVSPLGKGGMGEVYKAHDTRLDRTVAIKVLSVPGDDLRARFEREARAVAGLNHPQICAVYDVGRQDAVDYLVMEYLDGQSLADRLARGPLALPELLRYAVEIGSALAAAHRAGIVHRDLKPSNVMLARSGPGDASVHARLLDFGLARLQTDSALVLADLPTLLPKAPPLTAQGALLGTLHYMAPEQLDGREADTRADIWAFGCVLYEMASGRRPFDGETPASVIAAIMSGEPAPLSATAPVAPPALDRLVHHCLAKDKDARFQSIQDVVFELAALQESANAPSSSIGVPRRPGPRARRALLAGTAVLLTAAGFWGGHLAGVARRDPVAPSAIRFQIPAPDGRHFWTRPAVSPDGRQVVFVTVDDRFRSQLWIRPMDGAEARLLAGTDGAKFPFWSPDSRSVAFFADGYLKRLDLDSSAPVSIADAPDGRGGTWNDKGVVLFSPSVSSSLVRVPAAGGDAVPVTVVDQSRGDVSHRFPQFLSDGDHFIYWVMNRDPARSGIRCTSLSSPAAGRDLARADDGQYVNGLAFFSRNGGLLVQAIDALTGRISGPPTSLVDELGESSFTGLGAYSVSPSGVIAFMGGRRSLAQLTWVARDGRRLGAVGPVAVQNAPSLSPDGRHIAIARVENRQSAIWLVDVARGTWITLTTDGRRASHPVWSPDGRTIAFQADRGPGGAANIWLMSADGSTPTKPVVEGAASMIPVGWTPGARNLVWMQIDARSIVNLWMQSSAEGATARPWLQSESSIGSAQVSPDGKWIAYSWNATGQYEIYVERFPGHGGRQRVSTAGGTQPRWRRDGKELYFLSADDRIMAVAVRQESELTIGAPTALFQTHVNRVDELYQYDVTADGQRFLVNVLEPTPEPPLTVIVNWSASVNSSPR